MFITNVWGSTGANKTIKLFEIILLQVNFEE
jgi:hypothetical protein